MKTKTILHLSTSIAACAALLSGCYQTPEIDSQPEQEPKIVVDAKSEYSVASASSDPVIFSISANTPWYIENDAEDWCTPTPGASATSSLTEDITVTIDDNPATEPRTATLTITAEGVAEPVLVKITQNALSKLEVSAASGNIDQNGGSVTFTVLSDQDWSISSVPTWLTLSANSGTGSDQTKTVTASAEKTTSMRSATLRVENAEGDFRTVTITQEGDVALKFSEVDDNAKTFAYNGETKTFHIEASMLWKVSCSDPAVKFSQTQGTTSGDIQITLPYSKYINDKTYTITLESDDESIEIDPATLVITQDSFADPVNSPSLEGFTLSANNGTAYVKSKEAWKYGTFTWTFSNVNLTSGYFDINNWGADGITLMIRFGGDSNVNMVGFKGYLVVNDRVLNFGIDHGWGSTETLAQEKPDRKGYDYDFKNLPFNDISLNELRTLKFEITPDTRSGTNQNKILSRKLWINDQLVFEFSKTAYPETESARPGDPSLWCGADIWMDGSTHPGLQYQFGIGGTGNGSITIDSFEYTPIE